MIATLQQGVLQPKSDKLIHQARAYTVEFVMLQPF